MVSLHDDDDSSAFLFQEMRLPNASSSGLVKRRTHDKMNSKEDSGPSRISFVKMLKNIGNRMALSSASDHSTASCSTDDTHSVASIDDKDALGDSPEDSVDYGYGFAAPDRDTIYVRDDTLKLSGIKWKKTRDNEKYVQLNIISQETVVLVRRAPAATSSSRTRLRQVSGRSTLRRTASSNGMGLDDNSTHDGMDASERSSQRRNRTRNLNFDDNIRGAARAPPVRRARRRASM